MNRFRPNLRVKTDSGDMVKKTVLTQKLGLSVRQCFGVLEVEADFKDVLQLLSHIVAEISGVHFRNRFSTILKLSGITFALELFGETARKSGKYKIGRQILKNL